MKKLIYGAFFLILVGVGVIACTKHSENSIATDNTELSQNKNSVLPIEVAGPGFRIFTVQLHRPKGKVNRHGVECRCVVCAGFCEFAWFPDANKAPTVGVDFISATTARLYFFEALDVDDVNDPVFFIDEEVLISEKTEDFKIAPGQYPVQYAQGVIKIDDDDYTYNAYIDAPYSKH